jgi:hypothetical protein
MGLEGDAPAAERAPPSWTREWDGRAAARVRRYEAARTEVQRQPRFGRAGTSARCGCRRSGGITQGRRP